VNAADGEDVASPSKFMPERETVRANLFKTCLHPHGPRLRRQSEYRLHLLLPPKGGSWVPAGGRHVGTYRTCINADGNMYTGTATASGIPKTDLGNGLIVLKPDPKTKALK